MEDFWLLSVCFTVLIIIFDFFLYAVAEPVWMESVSGALKVRGSSRQVFYDKYSLPRRGRF